MATRTNEVVDSCVNKRVYTPQEIMIMLGFLKQGL